MYYNLIFLSFWNQFPILIKNVVITSKIQSKQWHCEILIQIVLTTCINQSQSVICYMSCLPFVLLCKWADEDVSRSVECSKTVSISSLKHTYSTILYVISSCSSIREEAISFSLQTLLSLSGASSWHTALVSAPLPMLSYTILGLNNGRYRLGFFLKYQPYDFHLVRGSRACINYSQNFLHYSVFFQRHHNI